MTVTVNPIKYFEWRKQRGGGGLRPLTIWFLKISIKSFLEAFHCIAYNIHPSVKKPPEHSTCPDPNVIMITGMVQYEPFLIKIQNLNELLMSKDVVDT